METKNIRKHNVPSVSQPMRVSKAALGLIVAAFVMVGLLLFSTLENINRAQVMMENFMVQKGESIIRSIEAGTRTMMHHLSDGQPLQTLILENSREEKIIFIRILDKKGKVLAQTGNATSFPISLETIARLLEKEEIVTHQDKEKGQFSLSRQFQLSFPKGRGGRVPWMMQRRHQKAREMFNWDEMVISVGLMTTEFDLARKQDVRHSLFMGAILLMVGSAGFYFLYLYQGIRVAQTTLANMKLYTDNVIESIPAGLLTLDSNNRIVSCNRNLEKVVGKSFAEIKGLKIHKALPGCPYKSSSTEDENLEFTTECTRHDGTKVPIKVSSSSLLDHDGYNIGTVLIIRDMSQLMEMEQQLERSRRMAALGKMAAGIAHEIRNPLGTLRGFAQYFGTRAGEDTESKGYADLMVSEVDRLNHNISGLLQFARPRELQKERVEVDGLISKAIALMEGDLKTNKVNLHCECNTKIELQADPDLLLQVLLNLLKNSINAVGESGGISLSAREQRGQVVFSVIDTGVGMTAKERERMFDPFFTTKKTGTGLGLAVSHQIIEQHNGSFEVISTPDKGTEIHVILPKN